MASLEHIPCLCLQVEKLARTLFLWKIEVHDQKERVYEMRRWNEALVTNMLPEHVARHFLGSKKRDEVRSGLMPQHGAMGCVSSSGFPPGSTSKPRLLVAWNGGLPQTLFPWATHLWEGPDSEDEAG